MGARSMRDVLGISDICSKRIRKAGKGHAVGEEEDG